MRFRGLDLIGPFVMLVLVLPVAVGAQRIDTWGKSSGPLDLSGDWRRYPGSSTGNLRTPPIVVVDEGRPALRIETDHESVAILRDVQIDVAAARYLVWEWKVRRLPAGGDVRIPTRNDQAARVMVLFEGMKAITYVWDTVAPVGTVVRPETFGLMNQALVVIRSGASGAGQWQRERRDTHRDYRQLFGERPRRVKALGLESHSDDVGSQSAVEFGAIGFNRK